MLPETHRERSKTVHSFTLFKGIHNIRAAFTDVDARRVYIASFLYMCGFSFFISFIGVLLVAQFSLNEGSVGTFFGVVGAWIVFTQLVILRFLARKYSERAILRIAIPTMGFALALYPFVPSVLLLYAAIPLIAVPNGLALANIGALVSKSVSPGKQGAALGINSSLMAFAQGVIPLVAGVGTGIVGIKAPFVVGGAIVFAAWGVLFVRSV
jgi:predicted MFS family arabinose efflux permease